MNVVFKFSDEFTCWHYISRVFPQRDCGSVGHVDFVSRLTSCWEELKL